jgi:hypothetical protein
MDCHDHRVDSASGDGSLRTNFFLLIDSSNILHPGGDEVHHRPITTTRHDPKDGLNLYKSVLRLYSQGPVNLSVGSIASGSLTEPTQSHFSKQYAVPHRFPRGTWAITKCTDFWPPIYKARTASG